MATPQEKQQLCDWVVSDEFKAQVPDEISVSDLIKKGGQGAVFKGLHAGRDAAIKVYYPGQLDQRVEREINALSTLDCSSIVRLHWSGTITYDGTTLPVTSTEFIEGDDLRDLINQGALPESKVGKIAFDVAKAVAALWDKRIVHRDLKPDNIMVRPNGRYCVIDLGVARHLDDSTLTATGFTWGTAGYFSPEQAKARRSLTFKSDVFALGIIVLEAALGHHPTGRNQWQVFAAGFHQQLPPPADGFAFASLLKQMLSPSPLSRPDPKDILSALNQYAN